MTTEDYEDGWQHGYRSYQDLPTGECEFRTVSLKNQSVIYTMGRKPVEPELQEFARGHMDGWSQALYEARN